ncbi:hypothetical protein Tco_0724324 [Tanacetum coccineum]
MPPTPNLSFTGLVEFVNKPVIENRKSNEEVSKGNPQIDLQDHGVIYSICSRHMTGNISYLTDYEEIDGGYVAFGGNLKERKITGKCTIKTGINLLLLLKDNAARHNLLLLVTVNVVEKMLEGVDCLPNATIFEQLALMSSKTITWNEFSSTMASAIICLATNQKFNFSKFIFESMGEDLDNWAKFYVSKMRAVYKELDTVWVLDLETTKTTQANEIASLKRRVKKLEQKKKTITLVNDQDDADMFDVNTLNGDEVLAEPEVVVKDVNLTVDEVTLAQALAELKSVKPKVSASTTTTTATIPTPRKGIVITELGTSTTTTTIISSQPSQIKVQDKGNGIIVEEPVKSMKKKDLVMLDEEIASKLKAKFDEEERLAREKDEANVALTEEWDDIQAKVDADYQLAQRL